MDVAALSIDMNQSSLAQQVGICVARKAMDAALEKSQALTKMMEQSVNPNLGGNLDIRI